MVSDINGKFTFARIDRGKYLIKVTFIGYKTYSHTFEVKERTVDLGVIRLEEDPITLGEVEIVGKVPMGDQKGDTVKYNAEAFKVLPDASAEDLVQKLPGVTIQDGNIQAQGENIQHVFVDGKRFFDGDVNTALRNLPAEIIDQIEIFDRRSDESVFSGFDDGNRAKTINIVTKPNRRKGLIGKTSAAYGSDNRYMVGASINAFKGDTRFTFSGISNNINMSDFSIGETPGGGNRGRRGRGNQSGSIGGPSGNGISSINNIALNYNDMWGKKMEVSGNYAYTHRNTDQYQSVYRGFIAPRDSGQVYSENNLRNNITADHRLNMRLEYNINERNRLLISPNVTFHEDEAFYSRTGHTFNDYGDLNQSENTSISNNLNYSFSNNILYSHRFVKPGRAITANLNTSFNNNLGEIYRLQNNIFFNGENRNELIDQYVTQNGLGYSWRGTLSYSEPLSDSSRIQLRYRLGNRLNDSDRRTYSFMEQTGEYDELNISLSNTFVSEFLTQGYEASYQYNGTKKRLQMGVEYQQADLHNNQQYPFEWVMNPVRFTNILPSAQYQYRFSQTRNIRIDYRTNTMEPSVSQLQDVIDNSNPLHLRTGNPDLKQSFQNRMSLRYQNFNSNNNHSFFISVIGSYTSNSITNSTFRAIEPINLTEDIILRRGSQLTRPVNVDNDWNIRTFFNFGRPLDIIKSNFNVGGSVGFINRPGVINDEINYSRTINTGVRFNLSSNISKKIDFNLSSNSSYNIVNNSLLPERNNTFFNQSTFVRYNWIFWKNLVYRSEFIHQLNAGLADGFNNNFMLWNMSISKKIFKNQQGEISASVNDLLNQNMSISRNVTDAYIEDNRSNVLQRYFMLTFTYNIRNFAGSGNNNRTPMNDNPHPNRQGRPGRWGGMGQ